MNARGYGVATAAFLFLLTAPTVAGQSPEAPVLLRMVPPKGQVSRYVFSMQTDVDSPMVPASGPLMTMRFFQTQTVLDVAGEVIRYRTTIDSTTMTTAMPGMDMLPDLAESAFTTEIGTRGEQLGVTDSEGFPDVPGFNMEDFLQDASYFVLPDQVISPGDSWTQGAPMSLPMGPAGSVAAEVEMTHTFVSLEGTFATISFQGPIEMEMDMGGMGVTATGTITGTMVVDLAEGRYQSQVSQTSLDIDMGAMAMKSTTTTTLELLPDP